MTKREEIDLCLNCTRATCRYGECEAFIDRAGPDHVARCLARRKSYKPTFDLEKAVELRRSGMRWTEIADALGCPHRFIHNRSKSIQRRVNNEITSDDNALRRPD